MNGKYGAKNNQQLDLKYSYFLEVSPLKGVLLLYRGFFFLSAVSLGLSLSRCLLGDTKQKIQVKTNKQNKFTNFVTGLNEYILITYDTHFEINFVFLLCTQNYFHFIIFTSNSKIA